METGLEKRVTDKQVKAIGRRISALPDALIDEYFYRCKLIYERRDYNMKALHHKLLCGVRKNKGDSEAVRTLLKERDLTDVLKCLEQVEDEYKSLWKPYL